MKPKSKIKTYSPNKLRRCLSDIKNNKYSVTEASRMYNIPRSTLSCKLLKIRPEEKTRKGPEAVLGAKNEEIIVTWILDQARRGFPLNKNELLYSVQKIAPECCDENPFPDGPGRKWYRSFLERHPILSEKKSEYLSAARADLTEERIQKWFETVEELLGEKIEVFSHPDRVYNVDESAFFLNSNGKVVLAERGARVYQISKNSDKENITISICANALGEFAPSLVVYDYERLPLVCKTTLPSSWSVKGNGSGWMTGETFYEYFANVFVDYKKKKHGDETIIVIFDGHRSHLTLQVSNLARENGIELICLPPSATHALQPLDVALFKGFKHYWRTERDMYQFKMKRDIFKHEVPIVLQIIITKYANEHKQSLISGFKTCGLCPWNVKNIGFFKHKKGGKNKSAESSTSYTTILDFVESKIDDHLLLEFRNVNQQLWTGDDKQRELYQLWRSLVDDSRSRYPIFVLPQDQSEEPVSEEPISELPVLEEPISTDPNCTSQNERVIILEYPAELESEPATELDLIGDENNHSQISNDTIFDWSALNDLFEPRAESTPNHENSTIDPVENSVNVRDSTIDPIENSMNVEDSSIDQVDSIPNTTTHRKTLESVLNHLARGDCTAKKGKRKPTTTSYLPVITSDQWREIAELKKKEAEEKENIREIKRKEREEKKKLLEEKKRLQAEKKKQPKKQNATRRRLFNNDDDDSDHVDDVRPLSELSKMNDTEVAEHHPDVKPKRRKPNEVLTPVDNNSNSSLRTKTTRSIRKKIKTSN